jgi:putative endonuclease
MLLTFKGYRILARRMKTRAGEIDLIARRGQTLVFVEVKARSAIGDAAEALSVRQRDRLARAAALYLASRPQFASLTIRFDMVLASPHRLPQHLVDAWRPS